MLTHLVKVPLMLRPAAMEDLPALMLLQGNSGGVPQVGPRRPQPLLNMLWQVTQALAPFIGMSCTPAPWLISTDHLSIIG